MVKKGNQIDNIIGLHSYREEKKTAQVKPFVSTLLVIVAHHTRRI